MPRLKTNRKSPHQCFHQSVQRGDGVGDIARWVLNKGKKGLLFASINDIYGHIRNVRTRSFEKYHYR